MLEAPGLHEQPDGGEVRYLRPGGWRLPGGFNRLRLRPDGDQGRQGARGNEAGGLGYGHTFAVNRPRADFFACSYSTTMG